MIKMADDDKNNYKGKGCLIGVARKFTFKLWLSLTICFFLCFITTGCCFAKDLENITSCTLKRPKKSWWVQNGCSVTKLNDGRILITGGLTIKNYVLIFPMDVPTNQSQIYDPKTKKISFGPNMLFNRCFHQSILLPDGRVFIFGGTYYTNYDKTEFYNPDTNTFIEGPSLIDNNIDSSLGSLGYNAWFIDDKKQYLCILTPSRINLYDLKNDKIYAIDAIHYDYKAHKFIGTNTIIGFEDKAIEKFLIKKMKKYPLFYILNNFERKSPYSVVHYKDDLYYLFEDYYEKRRNIFLYDANTKEIKVIYTQKCSSSYSRRIKTSLKLKNNKVLFWTYAPELDSKGYCYNIYQVFDMDTQEIKRLKFRTRYPLEAPILLDDGTIFCLNRTGSLFIYKFKEGVLD